MKTLGARVTDETYDALREYCGQRGISVNECLTGIVQDLLGGRIRFKGLGLADSVLLCPECNFLLFYASTKAEGPHVFCARCGWWSKIKLPEEWHEGKLEIK